MREAGRGRAQGAGCEAFHLPGHGQPRRRHRRGPAPGAGGLRRHRELRRLPDPVADGSGRAGQGRRDARLHGQARRRCRRRRLRLPHQAAHQLPRPHRERHREDDDHRHGQDHRRHRAAHQRHGHLRRAAAQDRQVHHVQEELPVRRGHGGERRRRDRGHRGRAGRASCGSASRSCRPRPRR